MKITLEWLEKNRASNGKIDWFLAQRETDGIKVLEKLREGGRGSFLLWLTPRLMTKKQAVEWACFATEQVLHLFEERHPQDMRPRQAIEAVRAWLQEPSEDNEKAAQVASAAAYTAAKAADAAYVAADTAACAAAYVDRAIAYAVADTAAYAADAATLTAKDDAAKAAANVAADKIREAIMDKALEILTQKTK